MYLLGLVGWPVEHSISPQIHQAALQAAGLEGEYRLFPIPPSEGGRQAFEGLLGQLRQKALHGLNVTIPHKRVAIPFLDRLTPIASAIGTVNTLVNEEGLLLGDNTDAPGFLRDLEQNGMATPGAALVLGAGGAARAVVYILLQAGWEVFFAARKLESAQMLVKDLRSAIGQTGDNGEERPGNARGEAGDIRSIPMTPKAMAEVSPACQLLVNCTPVGLAPIVQASPWPLQIPFPPEMAVYDLVYNPTETSLVRAARKAGLRAMSGLGMLIEQAALSFEWWTGRAADRAAMHEAASRALQARQ